MLSNLERIELMRERTKRARDRLDKLVAARKRERLRDEATEFCRTVQDWHVHMWAMYRAGGFARENPVAAAHILDGPGKYEALGLSRELYPRPWAGDLYKAMHAAQEAWKASRKKPKAPKPEGPPNRVYTNSPDFNEDQQRKRTADSVADAAAVLIIVAVGYAFLIA